MQNSTLVKGLGFSLLPKQLKYYDYLINLELLCRSIDNLKILLSVKLYFIKTRIKGAGFKSIRNYNANVL